MHGKSVTKIQDNLSSSRDTPVLLVVFNRPQTTAKVFEAIRHAKPKRLYIASDGPRPAHETDASDVDAVRKIVKQVDWSCDVKTLFNEENLGCKYGPVSAFNWFFEHEKKGIILEDDCMPSQSFFRFCHESLDRYESDRRIWDISGTNMIGACRLVSDASYCYSSYGGIWGWATWRDRWQSFEPEFSKAQMTGAISQLVDNLEDWEFPEVRLEQFRRIIEGLDAWDYQWLFNRLSNSGLSVVPSKNLITNIGFGDDATHTVELNANANRERFELEFPLKSPPYVMRDRNRDRALLHRAFAHRRASRMKRGISRLRRILFR